MPPLIPPIIVHSPLPPVAPEQWKRPHLEAIPEEEEEPLEPQHKKFKDEPFSIPEDTPPGSPQPGGGGGAEWGGHQHFDDALQAAFGCLAISPTGHRRAGADEIPPDSPGEGASKKPGPSKPFQHGLAEAGPLSQQTLQMEKDLEKTLLKRYEEDKALEKNERKKKR
jgi:hypothetical protein